MLGEVKFGGFQGIALNRFNYIDNFRLFPNVFSNNNYSDKLRQVVEIFAEINLKKNELLSGKGGELHFTFIGQYLNWL